jgi:spermidine synthase
MAGWLQDAMINTDRNLRLQYLAGLGLNLYQADPIYKAMILQSRYPDGLFTGSEATLQTLRDRIETSLARSRPF